MKCLLISLGLAIPINAQTTLPPTGTSTTSEPPTIAPSVSPTPHYVAPLEATILYDGYDEERQKKCETYTPQSAYRINSKISYNINISYSGNPTCEERTNALWAIHTEFLNVAAKRACVIDYEIPWLITPTENGTTPMFVSSAPDRITAITQCEQYAHEYMHHCGAQEPITCNEYGWGPISTTFTERAGPFTKNLKIMGTYEGETKPVYCNRSVIDRVFKNSSNVFPVTHCPIYLIMPPSSQRYTECTNATITSPQTNTITRNQKKTS